MKTNQSKLQKKIKRSNYRRDLDFDYFDANKSIFEYENNFEEDEVK